MSGKSNADIQERVSKALSGVTIEEAVVEGLNSWRFNLKGGRSIVIDTEHFYSGIYGPVIIREEQR